MSNKTLLILAYDFPPYVSVGGLRPYSWYKYLKQFGIDPIVVTRQWDNKYGNQLDYISPGRSNDAIIEETPLGKIIQAPYKPNAANRLMLKYGDIKFKWMRKTITAFYEFIQFFLPAGPKSSIYKEADKYLKHNRVDAIIATGDPFILFHYASKLSSKYNIPWIADYRDPWSQKTSAPNNFILNHWHAYLENKIVRTSHKITTVDTYFKHLLPPGLKKGKEIIIIPNGFDPEAMENILSIPQQNKILKIAYIGYIYEWYPIENFLSVMSAFVKEQKGPKLELNFYGINTQEAIETLISEKFPNLKKHISVYPKIPNEQLLKILSEQNLYLLFNNYSFPGTKIYDYLGLKRSILFCYSNDEEAISRKNKFYLYPISQHSYENIQEDIINQTNSGYVIKNSKDLLEKLRELYTEFLKNGFIRCNTINVEKYSRKHQANHLAEIIKNISPETKQ